MRNWLRAGVGAIATIVGLSFAGTAFAAVNPALTVAAKSGSSPVVTINGAVDPANDPLARVQIYLPTGFDVSSPSGGSSVGTATLRGIAKKIDPSTEQMYRGSITAISPTDASVAYENTNCDPTTHAAAWMMRLNGPAGKVDVPVFVNKTTGSETQFGAYKLVVCMLSPDLPIPQLPDRSADTA